MSLMVAIAALPFQLSDEAAQKCQPLFGVLPQNPGICLHADPAFIARPDQIPREMRIARILSRSSGMPGGNSRKVNMLQPWAGFQQNVRFPHPAPDGSSPLAGGYEDDRPS